ncbi:MAG: GIY-YIG nuclease family protein, partial [Planctomycetales bacterium]|nr:GIY-YIG nuclease family protein [Planctomycetales bacterium]
MTMLLLLVCVVLLGFCIILTAFLLESKQVARQVFAQWREAIAGRLHLIRVQKDLKQTQVQLERAQHGIGPVVHRIVSEKHAEITRTIGSANRHAKLNEIQELLRFLAEHGYAINADRQRALFAEIELAYERAKRIEEEKARQAEIKAAMREEARIEREAERIVREAEKEAALKKRALEEAIRLLGNTHSAEIDRLRQELAEAQAKAERTKSMAQQTRMGFVYIISNIGSFGKHVYKIGLTRRLDPQERVSELSDASVPFSFDVHAVISSKDAPALEAKLHQALSDYRVNKVNLRKEFFRVDLETIVGHVRKHHGH